MSKKTWPAYAESRKAFPGVWEPVTRVTPDTALNPYRLAYLIEEAEKVGLLTELRPVTEGSRGRVLWVAWPA